MCYVKMAQVVSWYTLGTIGRNKAPFKGADFLPSLGGLGMDVALFPPFEIYVPQ
jgi:hypothetical protein